MRSHGGLGPVSVALLDRIQYFAVLSIASNQLVRTPVIERWAYDRLSGDHVDQIGKDLFASLRPDHAVEPRIEITIAAPVRIGCLQHFIHFLMQLG